MAGLSSSHGAARQSLRPAPVLTEAAPSLAAEQYRAARIRVARCMQAWPHHRVALAPLYENLERAEVRAAGTASAIARALAAVETAPHPSLGRTLH